MVLDYDVEGGRKYETEHTFDQRHLISERPVKGVLREQAASS